MASRATIGTQTSSSNLERHYPFSCGRDDVVALQRLQQMWKSEMLVDYTLVTSEGTEIPVHRSHLACMSDYMFAMLSGPMKESQEYRVRLPTVSAVGLKPILEFVYGGTLSISQENFYDIITVAFYLQIPLVITHCIDYMTVTITVETCAQYVELLDVYGVLLGSGIAEQLDTFVGDNLEALVSRCDQASLPLQIFTQYILSDVLWGNSEMDVYDAVMNWVKADENRKQHLSKLMRCVRFPMMTRKELQDLHSRDDGFSKSTDGEIMIGNALLYASANLKEKLTMGVDKTQTRPRGHETVVVCAHYETSAGIKYRLYALHWEDEAAVWVQFPELPQQLFRTKSIQHSYIRNHQPPSVVTVGSFIFLFGGYESEDEYSQPSKRSVVFDVRTWSWSELAPMITPRAEFPLVVDRNHIYAIGGITHRTKEGAWEFAGQVTASVDLYDWTRNSWTKAPPITTARFGHTAASFKGCVYVYGGFDPEKRVPHKCVPLLQRFDPGTQTWTNIRVPLFLEYTIYVGDILVSMEEKLYLFCLGAEKAFCFLSSGWHEFGEGREFAEICNRNEPNISLANIGGHVICLNNHQGHLEHEELKPGTCEMVTQKTGWFKAKRMTSLPGDEYYPFSCNLVLPSARLNDVHFKQ